MKIPHTRQKPYSHPLYALPYVPTTYYLPLLRTTYHPLFYSTTIVVKGIKGNIGERVEKQGLSVPQATRVPLGCSRVCPKPPPVVLWGMFSINTREIKRLEGDLKAFAARAYPFATKSTINSTAFLAQKEARAGVKREMVVRAKFTTNSILVEQARTLNVRRQMATVGSIADYMETQEFGGTKTKTGKEGVAIPTSFAAGQGLRKQPRTRLPTREHALTAIKLRRKRKRGATRGQRNFALVRQAATGGNKFIFMDLGRRKGIFKVTGGKRGARVRMVYDLSRQSVNIPAQPWLAPAVARTRPAVPGIYAKALRFQLRRLGLFR